MTLRFCLIASFSDVGFILIGAGVIIGFVQNATCSWHKARAFWRVAARERVSRSARVIATGLICVCICAASTKPAAPHRVEITAKRFSFEPAEITIQKGESTELVLKSSDVPHGLRIRELNLDLRTQKGKSATATITPQTSGVFVGHCSVFCGSGHGQMMLTIRVVG